MLQVLKQKRLYENQRGQLMNQQFNVDQTSFALQSMQDSVQTVQAMKAAGKELKAAFKQPELNINSIENLQDDLADMMVSMSCQTSLQIFSQTVNAHLALKPFLCFALHHVPLLDSCHMLHSCHMQPYQALLASSCTCQLVLAFRHAPSTEKPRL